MTTKEGDSKRLEAAKLFAQGYGYKAVSTELGINRETVRDWSYTWRALGTEGLIKESRKHYLPTIKLAAVHDRQNGLGVVEVMEKYQIQNRNRLKDWCKAYKEHGEGRFGKRRAGYGTNACD